MKESELKMMIREELQKIIGEEKIDEFLGQAAVGPATTRKLKGKPANKQSEQLKQVAAQLQQIVKFLNQMAK